MESSLDARLQPIRDQALWVARDVSDLSDPAALDDYFFGVLAATPQVAGIAVISVDGSGRRWHRNEHVAIDRRLVNKSRGFTTTSSRLKRQTRADWREPIFTDTVNSATLLHDVPLHDAKGEFIGIFAQIVTVKELSSIPGAKLLRHRHHAIRALQPRLCTRASID